MSNVEELMVRVGAIIEGKGKGVTSYKEKHGLFLYYYALFKIHGKEQYFGQMRVTLLNMITELLQHGNHTESVVSFPLISNLFEDNLVNDELEEKIVFLDRCLFDKANFLLKTKNVNFLGGALGIIHYFAERLPNLRAENYLKALLLSLYPVIETQYALTASSGTVSLGLPDGLLGALLVLIKCYERGMQEEKIKQFTRAEMLKIVSYRVNVDFGEKIYSVFPDSVNLHHASGTYSNGLSWRNGDLNKCMLFYKARQLFEDADLSKSGDLIGLNTLLRKTSSTTNITTSEFSRGSAGLAQTYWFLFNMTRHQSYRAGYEHWMSQTVDLLEGELASGFHTRKELDVSDGLVGVALTLLSYHHPNRVKWSHCLLL